MSDENQRSLQQIGDERDPGYSYDGAGNETAITGYNDPASTSFSYNNLNQLKGLTPPQSQNRQLRTSEAARAA